MIRVKRTVIHLALANLLLRMLDNINNVDLRLWLLLLHWCNRLCFSNIFHRRLILLELCFRLNLRGWLCLNFKFLWLQLLGLFCARLGGLCNHLILLDRHWYNILCFRLILALRLWSGNLILQSLHHLVGEVAALIHNTSTRTIEQCYKVTVDKYTCQNPTYGIENPRTEWANLSKQQIAHLYTDSTTPATAEHIPILGKEQTESKRTEDSNKHHRKNSMRHIAELLDNHMQTYYNEHYRQ